MKIMFYDEQEKIKLAPEVKQAVIKTVEAVEEEIGFSCCETILFTDNVGIRRFNREFRGIDRATDAGIGA